MDRLREDGYAVQECLLCPTELGLPNRRQRFYLVAARGSLNPWPPPRFEGFSIPSILEDQAASDLAAPLVVLQTYRRAIHIVRGDQDSITHCFTSAYGHSHVRSGSYLYHAGHIRRFSPPEILKILGFPAAYHLPRSLTLYQAWRLVGNSLSVPAVRHILSCIPELVLAGKAASSLRHLTSSDSGFSYNVALT